jgi:murein DD-endopeptidase MepM/ murein hydrolase activator NlpD
MSDPAQPDGWARALGPMQFLSSTWARWGRLAPGRPHGARPSVQNAWDAIYSAAAYLCGDDGRIDDLRAAILTYNPSNTYVDTVIAKAAEYGMGSAVGAVAVDGMFCPVAGPISFSDDFGAPRSGGRRHQGNDLFAQAGTPTVAIESGVIDRASPVERGLGGITIWLRGDSGTRFYYAHHRSNAVGVGARVQAGQIVGYVGNTGNARTTASHLHFEIHPDGGVAVSPYRTVSSLCGGRR